MLRKAVIPAAGLGTRLLPATKELPKEMLPIFVVQVYSELASFTGAEASLDLAASFDVI